MQSSSNYYKNCGSQKKFRRNISCVGIILFYRIISEFESVREQALTKPEDTREMIDMLKFVEEAKTKILVKLDSDIKVTSSTIFLS